MATSTTAHAGLRTLSDDRCCRDCGNLTLDTLCPNCGSKTVPMPDLYVEDYEEQPKPEADTEKPITKSAPKLPVIDENEDITSLLPEDEL